MDENDIQNEELKFKNRFKTQEEIKHKLIKLDINQAELLNKNSVHKYKQLYLKINFVFINLFKCIFQISFKGKVNVTFIVIS